MTFTLQLSFLVFVRPKLTVSLTLNAIQNLGSKHALKNLSYPVIAADPLGAVVFPPDAELRFRVTAEDSGKSLIIG